MAMSGLSFENTLVGTGWAVSVLLCTDGLRKQSSNLVGPPFPAVKFVFFPAWTSSSGEVTFFFFYVEV